MPAYRNADELPHPKTMMSLKEASNAIGLSVWTLRQLIREGKLGAFERRWRYGVFVRRAYYVPVADLKKLVTRLAAEKITGRRITWTKKPSPQEEGKV